MANTPPITRELPDDGQASAPEQEEKTERWLPYAAIAALAICLFALRLAAPPNLLDQDQERPAAYVLDAVKNGNWLCQRDLSGDITSKPPLWTWLSALTTLACGRISVFSLYLPGALAALGTAWLVFAAARGHFGTRAAFFSALASMLTTAGLKEFGLARTDGVFSFTVTATALLAFRAWKLGRGWTWFWLMAAAATLTKGPLGLLLGGGGLLASWWERREKERLTLRGSQWAGLGLFVLVTVGWLALSYWQLGPPVLSKLLDQELKAQALTRYERHLPGSMFWQPPLYYLGRAAPWSLLAYYGLWRIWRRPAQDAMARRFERFLFCWLLFGMFLFCLAPHQRADLLWPIMPAGAILAGRELDRLTQPLRRIALASGFALLLALGLGGFAFYYFGPRANTPIIQQTIALKALAAELERRGGPEFPLTHVDDPMTLQIYLSTFRPPVSHERAAQLLRGPEAAFVALNDLAGLRAARQAADPPLYLLLPDPGNPNASPARIVGNRPQLKPVDPIAFCFGTIFVRATGARLLQATEQEFCFAAAADTPAEVLVTNESSAPRRVRLCVSGHGPRASQERLLAAHEEWKLKIDADSVKQRDL